MSDPLPNRHVPCFLLLPFLCMLPMICGGCLLPVPFMKSGVFMENPQQDDWSKIDRYPEHFPRENIYIKFNNPVHLRMFVFTGYDREVRTVELSPAQKDAAHPGRQCYFEKADLETRPALIGIELCGSYDEFSVNPMNVFVEINEVRYGPIGFILTPEGSPLQWAEHPKQYPVIKESRDYSGRAAEQGFLIFFDLSYRQLREGKLHIEGLRDRGRPVAVPPTKFVGFQCYWSYLVPA